MIEPTFFCDELARRSVEFYTGVPCSFFQGPISLLGQGGRGRYVAAANEGAALAMATGAELAGTRSAVMLQNSGFGNLLNPLTSLVMTFRVPALVFMSLRGWPDPAADEPQHAVMGASQHALLDALGIDRWTLPPTEDGLVDVLDQVEHSRAEGRPAFVLVPKNTVGVDDSTAPPAAAPFGRRQALSALAPHLGDAAVYATTGFISRELYSVAHRPDNFYMQGSMGHALSLGVGSALADPMLRTVVIDGDGAALMHLGSCAVTGAAAPPNLTHVVLDNGAYESTGAQQTLATVDWDAFGRSVGYRTARTVSTADGLDAAMRDIADAAGPHLVVARIGLDGPGQTPPRVTSGHSPFELRCTFSESLTLKRSSHGR
ncbi:phosphonopyruvate decarboxylase [Streptomyces sp. NRRL S-15]|uniref:phosphonopyruvate decarboxylase n=1 Tax=Streptomyces sp. NRRL S-15 TaxID=1463886 RepID=UPI0004C64389|nr:phosphonopyruvate decarboxylase [Streptomyces sp. NRRL S-15]